jgi:hypothetical protein
MFVDVWFGWRQLTVGIWYGKKYPSFGEVRAVL